MDSYHRRLEDELEGVEEERAQRILALFTSAMENAERDPLTQLPRRSGVRRAFSQRAQKVRVPGYHLGVFLADVDHFKLVNDDHETGYKGKFKHEAGDVLLADVASVMKNTLRPGDMVGRWGGEEFVGLLPLLADEEMTPAERALTVAERVRQRVATQTGHTLSIGVTVYPTVTPVLSLTTMVAHADTALYAAKQTGRNRCVLYSPVCEQHVKK